MFKLYLCLPLVWISAKGQEKPGYTQGSKGGSFSTLIFFRVDVYLEIVCSTTNAPDGVGDVQ